MVTPTKNDDDSKVTVSNSPEDRRRKKEDEEVGTFETTLEHEVSKLYADVESEGDLAKLQNVVRISVEKVVFLAKATLRSSVRQKLIIQDEKEELISSVNNLEKDKEKFDIIAYCNLYRRQIKRFETFFGKKGFYPLFKSFEDTLVFMVSFLNAKRKENKFSELLLDDTEKKQVNSFFRNKLTRIEKWIVILVWLFVCEIKIDETAEITKPIADIVKIASEDFKNLSNLVRFKAVYALRESFLSKMPITFKNDFRKLLDFEITGIANGLNEGFQRCSKEIKRWENLSATPEEYIVVRKKVISSTGETEDDYVINICMETIVNLGKELAQLN